MPAAKPETKSPPPATPASPSVAAKPDRKRAGSRDEARRRRRIAELEAQIASAEAELAAVEAELGRDPAGDWQRLNTLVSDKERLTKALGGLLAEWEMLGSD